MGRGLVDGRLFIKNIVIDILKFAMIFKGKINWELFIFILDGTVDYQQNPLPFRLKSLEEVCSSGKNRRVGSLRIFFLLIFWLNNMCRFYISFFSASKIFIFNNGLIHFPH